MVSVWPLSFFDIVPSPTGADQMAQISETVDSDPIIILIRMMEAPFPSTFANSAALNSKSPMTFSIKMCRSRHYNNKRMKLRRTRQKKELT